MGININKHTVMLKEVSALNTYWLLQYLQEQVMRGHVPDTFAGARQIPFMPEIVNTLLEQEPRVEECDG